MMLATLSGVAPGQLFENVRRKRHDRRLPVACSERKMLAVARPMQGVDGASTRRPDDQFVGLSDPRDRDHAVGVTCRNQATLWMNIHRPDEDEPGAPVARFVG